MLLYVFFVDLCETVSRIYKQEQNLPSCVTSVSSGMYTFCNFKNELPKILKKTNIPNIKNIINMVMLRSQKVKPKLTD